MAELKGGMKEIIATVRREEGRERKGGREGEREGMEEGRERKGEN